MKKTLAIIPSAGFGTRMNVGRTDAKELLIDPVNNKPLIDWHLELANNNDLNSLVITRQAKQELINYLGAYPSNPSVLILEETKGEWPSTILESFPMWEENNILLLPDSRFKPSDEAIKSIKTLLEEDDVDLVIAIHMIDDSSKWGIVSMTKDEERIVLEEKPERLKGVRNYAWGILGFKKNVGKSLLESMEARAPHITPENTKLVELESFVDITRTGKLEKY